ncbi:MAG: stalk domain-containing protein [Peptoniphilus duerdenii]|uniref:stalk domain-containing protein n=1 Tax=Peptoniphilus duerdenii TaxID=507750 RepID=UPI00254C99DC|nr:stalk domain-containing protein [Peptoniphilus duerdenii]MDK8276440.1 stalk domain-containing protein [Peptoniphilus duerdenii]
MKRLLTMTLAFVLTISTISFAKENKEAVGYERVFGKVTEVVEDKDNSQILVESKDQEKSMEKLYLYTGKVPVLDLKTGKFVENYKFKKGDMIEYFYKKDAPIMLSMPAKLNPDFIVINAEDGEYSVDVDHFNEKGRGVSNRVEINLSDDSKVVNLKGEEVGKFQEGDYAVIYKTATRSMPPIVDAEKIVALEAKAEDPAEKEEKNIGLRKYYEELGAKVEWNKETRTIKISSKDKSVEIDVKRKELTIEEKVMMMEGFKIEKGTSLVPEQFINKIDKFLLNK